MKVYLKILSLILVVALSFSIVACSHDNATNDKPGNVEDNNDGSAAPEGSDTNQNNTNNETQPPVNNEGDKDNTKDDEVIFTPVEDDNDYTTVDNVSMESNTDKFELLDNSYAADESFVYTATASFESGVASGIVFGAEDGNHYWVFNIDREANLVKLLYFTVEDGKTRAFELLTDYFIGNDKMTESERRLVAPKVASIDKVQLKVVITPEEDGVYAEFYADNIRRFGIDNVIDLNSFENLSYEGGSIGFNCFNSKVKFADIYYGKSDYSYYTELYRNQYHFSQYAHWNNDPNGLIYYDGYYHLYYQHHPYSNYWSDMYWGHARSKDLAHWELLPI